MRASVNGIVLGLLFAGAEEPSHELAALPHDHPTLAEIWTYPAEALAERIPAPR
jgi:hypothetical protein